MQLRSAAAKLVITVTVLTSARAAAIPKFNDYPALSIFQGEPAAPRFRPGEDVYPNGVGHFRGSVIFDAKRGPNFAGTFTLARWSCGTHCSSLVIVNAKTGEIYRRMPFGLLILPRAGTDNAEYTFRLDSRLLVVEGYFDIEIPEKSSVCSRRYYEWTGTSFRLLRNVALHCIPPP